MHQSHEMSVIKSKKLSSPEKIMWLGLYYRYGSSWFEGTYQEMGEMLGMNEHTVKSQITKLRRNGAVKILSTYLSKESHIVGKGRSGSRFELVMPEAWENA